MEPPTATVESKTCEDSPGGLDMEKDLIAPGMYVMPGIGIKSGATVLSKCVTFKGSVEESFREKVHASLDLIDRNRLVSECDASGEALLAMTKLCRNVHRTSLEVINTVTMYMDERGDIREDITDDDVETLAGVVKMCRFEVDINPSDVCFPRLSFSDTSKIITRTQLASELRAAAAFHVSQALKRFSDFAFSPVRDTRDRDDGDSGSTVRGRKRPDRDSAPVVTTGEMLEAFDPFTPNMRAYRELLTVTAVAVNNALAQQLPVEMRHISMKGEDDPEWMVSMISIFMLVWINGPSSESLNGYNGDTHDKIPRLLDGPVGAVGACPLSTCNPPRSHACLCCVVPAIVRYIAHLNIDKKNRYSPGTTSSFTSTAAKSVTDAVEAFLSNFKALVDAIKGCEGSTAAINARHMLDILRPHAAVFATVRHQIQVGHNTPGASTTKFPKVNVTVMQELLKRTFVFRSARDTIMGWYRTVGPSAGLFSSEPTNADIEKTITEVIETAIPIRDSVCLGDVIILRTRHISRRPDDRHCLTPP